jgi:hypothetical protein
MSTSEHMEHSNHEHNGRRTTDEHKSRNRQQLSAYQKEHLPNSPANISDSTQPLQIKLAESTTRKQSVLQSSFPEVPRPMPTCTTELPGNRRLENNASLHPQMLGGLTHHCALLRTGNHLPSNTE